MTPYFCLRTLFYLQLLFNTFIKNKNKNNSVSGLFEVR